MGATSRRALYCLAVQMSVPTGSFRVMGVTPQILSRAVTDPLAHYIGEQLADRNAGDSWRSYLIRRIADGLRSTTPELAAWTVSRSFLSALSILYNLSVIVGVTAL